MNKVRIKRKFIDFFKYFGIRPYYIQIKQNNKWVTYEKIEYLGCAQRKADILANSRAKLNE